MEIVDINSALKVFNMIEDKRDRIRADYETKDRKLREVREEVELYLLEEMKRLNLTAFEVPGEGVANIRTKRRFGVADWGMFWTWVVQENHPDFLQKRLLDTAVQSYLETKGELPPAVNSEAKLVIAVTKRAPK